MPYHAGSGSDDRMRSHEREPLERLAVLEIRGALAETLVAGLVELGR